MKWQRNLFLALICVHLSAIPARGELDANAFLQTYDKGDNVTKRMYNGFLLGVYSGVGWADAFSKERRKQPPILCLPAGTVPSAEQLLKMLRQQVAEYPVSGEAPAGLALFAALRRAYLCRPDSADRPE